MCAQLSKKHHYVPQFLIKKFADQDEKVWVYNKLTKRFDKGKKSAAAVFYEIGRNIFEVNGRIGDDIEKIYTDLDNVLGKQLDVVLASKMINYQQLNWILYLVSLMKWRIPKADQQVSAIVKELEIKDLGLVLKPIDGKGKVDADTIAKIESLDIMQEVKRIGLSAKFLFDQKALEELQQNCFILVHDAKPALLGDCPIIELPNEDHTQLGDFIFPLSQNKTLICKRRATQEDPPQIFTSFKDMTIFHLAEKYVVCHDRQHLQRVIDTYAKLEAEVRTENLAKYIFDLFP